jgi:hypothetical protein
MLRSGLTGGDWNRWYGPFYANQVWLGGRKVSSVIMRTWVLVKKVSAVSLGASLLCFLRSIT